MVLVAGCGTAPGAGGQVPGAQPPPSAPVTAPAAPYRKIGPACPTISAAVLSRLGLSPRGKEDPPETQGSLTARGCSWASSSAASYGARQLIVQVTWDSAARSAAGDRGEFENLVHQQSSIDHDAGHAVPGLGNAAHVSDAVNRDREFRQAHLNILSQNLLVLVSYTGEQRDRTPVSEAVADNGAVTAGKAVLSALAPLAR